MKLGHILGPKLSNYVLILFNSQVWFFDFVGKFVKNFGFIIEHKCLITWLPQTDVDVT